MNAVEIEQAITDLAERPFDPVEFPFAFLEAFGNKEASLKKLRTGASNKSDIGGVLQVTTSTSWSAAPSTPFATAPPFLQDSANYTAARFGQIDSIYPRSFAVGRTWFHRYVLTRDALTNEGQGLTSGRDTDSTLVIADREHVLVGTKGKPRLRTVVQPGIDPEGPFALGRMRNLQRGKTPEFVGFWEELNWPSPDSALAVESEIEFQAAVGNALGVVVVNLSLSIRRAFDQVYEMRKAKGGPLWPKVAM